jgi:hypothetical protein
LTFRKNKDKLKKHGQGQKTRPFKDVLEKLRKTRKTRTPVRPEAVM